MAQKIVFLDVDGTLIGKNGYLPPSAAEACKEARRRGHLLYICSGRNMAELDGEIIDVGFDGIASAGGAHIEEASGKVIFDAVFPVEMIKKIAGYMEDHKCGFALEKVHSMLSNRQYVHFWEDVADKSKAEGKSIDKFVAKLIKLIKNQIPENDNGSCYEGVSKIVFVGTGSASYADVKKAFGHECDFFEASIPYVDTEGGEISPPGAHKGFALKKVAEYHGIPIADTIAFGDSDNDRPMIECAGIGVAMGNAKDSIKSIADEITTSLMDDGIYNGFKKLGLI